VKRPKGPRGAASSSTRSIRVTVEPGLLDRIDGARGKRSRSEFIGGVVSEWLDEVADDELLAIMQERMADGEPTIP